MRFIYKMENKNIKPQKEINKKYKNLIVTRKIKV